MENSRPTVGAVFVDLLRHPVRTLVVRWNWKAALLSALIRATIFFLTNLVAGWHAAVLRSATSGFYGGVTEAFSAASPLWAAMTVSVIGLPLLSHSLELLVHWLRGTPNLLLSVGVSMSFTAVSSAFNLYAMRQGVLTTGHGSKSLLEDLGQVPALLFSFVTCGPRALAGWCCRAIRSSQGA
jgi:hypothetical protein